MPCGCRTMYTSYDNWRRNRTCSVVAAQYDIVRHMNSAVKSMCSISATPDDIVRRRTMSCAVWRGRWKCRSGKCRSDNGWKAVRKEKYKIPTTWAEVPRGMTWTFVYKLKLVTPILIERNIARKKWICYLATIANYYIHCSLLRCSTVCFPSDRLVTC